MAEAIAVFDLEGTLCPSGGILWRAILKKQIGRGYGIGKVILHATLQIVTAFCYKARLVDASTVRRTITKSLAALLKGFTEDEVSQHAQLIAEKYTTRLRPDMERILQHHKLQRHTVVLVSGMFQPYLEAVGQKLGVDVIIGTKLEKISGYYTGRLEGAPCVSEQRVQMLKDLIGTIGLEVNLSESFAYGDTISDKPVLEMVGNPVAVYPDPEFEAYAKARGWRVIVASASKPPN